MKEMGEEKRVEVEIAEECGGYRLDSLESHEAGFDALMTGYSFLQGSYVLSKRMSK